MDFKATEIREKRLVPTTIDGCEKSLEGGDEDERRSKGEMIFSVVKRRALKRAVVALLSPRQIGSQARAVVTGQCGLGYNNQLQRKHLGLPAAAYPLDYIFENIIPYWPLIMFTFLKEYFLFIFSRW